MPGENSSVRHSDGRSSNGLKSFFLHAVSLAAISTSTCVFAQTWSGGSPYGGDVRVLLQSNDGQVLFAQTGGGLFRSDDHGAHWARKLAGSPGSGPGQFIGVAQSDAQPGRIYVGDIAGNVYRSDDNGETIANVSQVPTINKDLIGLVGVPGTTNQLFALTETSGCLVQRRRGSQFRIAKRWPVRPGNRVEACHSPRSSGMGRRVGAVFQFKSLFLYGTDGKR
jgi:hypothetical protein